MAGFWSALILLPSITDAEREPWIEPLLGVRIEPGRPIRHLDGFGPNPAYCLLVRAGTSTKTRAPKRLGYSRRRPCRESSPNPTTPARRKPRRLDRRGLCQDPSRSHDRSSLSGSGLTGPGSRRFPAMPTAMPRVKTMVGLDGRSAQHGAAQLESRPRRFERVGSKIPCRSTEVFACQPQPKCPESWIRRKPI
jgi:hypothetical protein